MQLFVVTQDYARFIDEKIPFPAIHFDFKAALDRVDYETLLTKMENVGIHEQTLIWCKKDLADRLFTVKVADRLSATSSHRLAPLWLAHMGWGLAGGTQRRSLVRANSHEGCGQNSHERVVRIILSYSRPRWVPKA